MSSAPSKVVWLPSHPSMGAASMDRYWREIDREYRRPGAAALSMECPLGAPPAESRRGSRLERAWQKYAAYPRLARRAARKPEVVAVHVLDHSFAHLLEGMPEHVFKVATVHDLAPLRDGTGLTARQIERFRRTVGFLRRADAVLADSRHSAEEAIELLGLGKERVQVLPLGVDVERYAAPVALEAALAERLAGRRVVLSVGTTLARKNLEALPAVFRELRAVAPDVRPVLLRVGPTLAEGLARELAGVLGADGFVELGLAPDEALTAAYQRADALIFPSRIEGFGFPVLEAMAAGCPVVCTDVTSVPEVGGEAALYFGPDDPKTAAGHLARLLEDEAFHRERVAMGRAQAARFSWGEHYRRLVEIYERR